MKATFGAGALLDVRMAIQAASKELLEKFPGDGGRRHPVHVVYGGGHLFKAGTFAKLGELALKSLDEYAPDAKTLSKAVGAEIPAAVYARVREKLQREPIEDFRIDFEDGYGHRPDEEEDSDAARTATELARAFAEGTLPPFCGVRVKSFAIETFDRALRTLDVFVSTLLQATGGKLPPGFVVTLPKVQLAEQVSSLDQILGRLEKAGGLPNGTLKIELMVETPQAIIGVTGVTALPILVRAGDNRCVGVHFGTYDYTASLDITSSRQHMLHPACDFAKHVMKVSLAGTGVALSDGAMNVMPIAPKDGSAEEKRETVWRAWRMSFEAIEHSLSGGFYQGWDLHPAQLPIRYAAVFRFFHEGQAAASARLKQFVERAAQATLLGDVFDDAATGQGLLNFFLRGISCGAITEGEALQLTGLTAEEIRSRSFMKILEGRDGKK